MSRLQFTLQTTDGNARRGQLSFPRGTVQTPAFMPVGTYGSVKGVLPEQVRALGAEIILGNTFHLYLRPGLDVIADHGGLHGFCRWNGPILTDSGGFQVFSLAHRRKITEQGVTFASPTDGARVFLGPEESMKIQKVLDSDIVMIFDECTLELPDAGELDIALRVLRSAHLTQDNGKPQHQVACRYFNLPDNRQIAIQQYIGTLERAVLARRWGIE